MAYIYRSKVGTFSIRADEASPGTFELCVGGIWLNNYETADSAAGAVYKRETGWYEWDCREDPKSPCNLNEWKMLCMDPAERDID